MLPAWPTATAENNFPLQGCHRQGLLGLSTQPPPQITPTGGSYYDILKTIFCLLKGDCSLKAKSLQEGHVDGPRINLTWRWTARSPGGAGGQN